MPFYDNTGIDPDEKRWLPWDALAAFFDQLERYIVLNLAWSLQLVPLILAFVFIGWPAPLRIGLVIYSVLALAAGMGVVFDLAGRALDAELLSIEMAGEAVRRSALPGLMALAPLYGIFGLLAGGLVWSEGGASPAHYLAGVGLRLLLLWAFVLSVTWGPIFAEDPNQGAAAILRRSFRLFVADALRLVGLAMAVVAAMALGVVSVGGLFLAAPVFIAILEIKGYRRLMTQ